MHSFYVSYLLRIWELDNRDPRQFLASLEKPGSHDLKIFNDLEELFDFLRSQIECNQKPKITNIQTGTED
jgi:hypothetical protein